MRIPAVPYILAISFFDLYLKPLVDLVVESKMTMENFLLHANDCTDKLDPITDVLVINQIFAILAVSIFTMVLLALVVVRVDTSVICYRTPTN